MAGTMFTKLLRRGEFNPPRAAAWLALASLLAGTARSEDAPAAPRAVREIRVRLACDEEWREQSGWKALARARLAEASGVFESRFGIRWAVADVVEWKSDDAAASLRQLLDQLERDVPRAGAGIVLAFSRQTGAAGSARAYRDTGLAHYFGPAAIVRDLDPEPRPGSNVGSLVHEMGHVLGAWHAAGLASVMSAPADRATSETFDPQSAAVIELCRDIDFARGAEWLDDARRSRMGEIFRAGHAAGERLTFVDVEMERAWRLLAEHGDVREARAAFRHALAEQSACVGPDDPSLVECLRALASADLAGEGADVGEAETLARLALALVAANGVAEEPPLATESLMADVARERGRFDEATVRYRFVYEARLQALGAADPYTADAKASLDRCGGTIPPARPWTDVECKLAPRSQPSAGLRFEAPLAGTIHVRALPRVPLFDGTARADWVSDTFAVTTPQSGELSVELRESGDAPSAPAAHALKRHVTTSGGPREVRVRFSFATPGPKAGDDRARYACELGIAAPGDDAPSSDGSFTFDAPWRAAARVTHALDAGAADFVCVPLAAPTTLRSWQWIGEQGQPVVAADREHEATVNGVRVTPDGTGAKCTWRLELTFTPDGAK